MQTASSCLSVTLALAIIAGSLVAAEAPASAPIRVALEQIGTRHGVVALLDLPDGDVQFPIELAKASELIVYTQSSTAETVAAARQAASDAGLLGDRVFVQLGRPAKIPLADNLADCVLVAPAAANGVIDAELLRVLRPRASAFVGQRRLVKPVPAGVDDWSHPYHGPDNNPNSNDQLVRGALRTQFIDYPMFSPMPEQTVVANGRIFKAMGHIAHKSNQNPMLNTLLCINAFNGQMLWKRPLPAGFMIHRNTMIATDDALLLGDDQSCKYIDATTGRDRDQLMVPAGISDGPVWKWMALQNGVLYALLGNPEIKVDTQVSTRRGLGHWPWDVWQGHDYSDPQRNFGFGRTLAAFDPATKKLLWHYRDEQFLDARGLCMNDNRIFFYSPEKFLGCVDASDGSLLWKNSDKSVLEAIAPNKTAQHYITGYATTCYMKCDDQRLFFAGPQRGKLVVVSAENGKLQWTNPNGNLQIVLRDDAVFAAGPQGDIGYRLNYENGAVLSEFVGRRACTRATGCADSIFFRAHGGTVRLLTETNTAQHIAPMRPPCQDGVIIAGGHLYWGPWMCGCQLSLYGNIGLAPVGVTSETVRANPADALVVGENSNAVVEPLAIDPHDWPSYRGGNARSDITNVAIPAKVKLAWQAPVVAGELPTAPVVAGGMIFVGDRSGAVQAFNRDGQRVWQAFTGGPVYYAPAVAHDRVYAGSADGRVYAFAARDGRMLWSYRVAPEERMIPVFGKLLSAWPVAGGVVVQDGIVYAAAGITHYDGTYVVGLDAITGMLKVSNTTSGTVAAEVNNGISMQGELAIVGNELQFLGGGVYETARYDLATLKCLNEPKVQVNSDFRTAFYPYYPEYGKYLSLDYTCPNGCLLQHDASYEGSQFTNLTLHSPLPPGVAKTVQEAARWVRRRGGTPPKPVWTDAANRRFTSFVIAPHQLLAAGHPDEKPNEAFLVCTNIADGHDAWLHPLPANAVKGGAAMDAEGRIYLTLENGQLLSFEPLR